MSICNLLCATGTALSYLQRPILANASDGSGAASSMFVDYPSRWQNRSAKTGTMVAVANNVLIGKRI
jgi:hypothetical protein